MRKKETVLTVTATSPATATSAVGGTFKSGFLQNADFLVIDATLTGATGGTLDVYLQHKVADDVFVDLVHFAQKTAGAATTRHVLTIDGKGTSIVAVGSSNAAAPGTGVALAAGATTNSWPAGDIRIVFVAGASTSAGASQTISITPYTERK